VIITWSPSETPGVVGYNVYRGTTPGGESSTPLNSSPIYGTSCADENVTEGASYYYWVTAIAWDGVTQSAPSNNTPPLIWDGVTQGPALTCAR
jgi:hypothetical protein